MSRGGLSPTPSLAAQRAMLVGAMAASTAASWMYLVRSGERMMGGPRHEVLIALPMWAAMMIGMMLPGATPMFAAYLRVNQRNGSRWQPLAAFVLAYASLWIGVSALGAWIQQALAGAGLLSHMGVSTRPLITGALLVLAGLSQFSPLKQACLQRCRTPLRISANRMAAGHVRGAHTRLAARRRVPAVLLGVDGPDVRSRNDESAVDGHVLTVLMLVEKTAPAGQIIGWWSGALFRHLGRGTRRRQLTPGFACETGGATCPARS